MVKFYLLLVMFDGVLTKLLPVLVREGLLSDVQLRQRGDEDVKLGVGWDPGQVRAVVLWI